MWVFYIMSTNSDSSSDTNLDLFRERVVGFLEISFFAFLALTVIGVGFYLSIANQNVQNGLSVLLTIFLGVFTWVMRAKIMQIEPNEVKIYLLQWIGLCTVVIVVSIIVILFYPYSQAF